MEHSQFDVKESAISAKLRFALIADPSKYGDSAIAHSDY